MSVWEIRPGTGTVTARQEQLLGEEVVEEVVVEAWQFRLMGLVQVIAEGSIRVWDRRLVIAARNGAGGKFDPKNIILKL